MATNTFVELDLPEAAELAGYSGILYDLETAGQFAKRLLDRRNDPIWDGELTDALTTALLVRYARPFLKSNARLALGPDATKLFNSSQMADHEYFMALRNKYAAHSDNAFEENLPVARYWVERVQQEGIEDVQCQQVRTLGLAPANLEAMRELVEILTPFVKSQIDEERARVLKIVRAKPLAEVLERAPYTGNPHPDAFQTRRRY